MGELLKNWLRHKTQVRRQQQVGQTAQRRLRWQWLDIKNVERRETRSTLAQRMYQGIGIDQGGAGGVNQQAVGPHGCQALGVDQMAGGGRGHQVQADYGRVGQQLF